MGFGSFDIICSQVSLPVCPLLGNVEPSCYSRNVDFGNGSLVFQPATLVINFVALIMTGIMIYHIRNKYTAVGRKEIVIFFYLYVLYVIVNTLLISGWIPISGNVYPWFAGIEVGLITALCWCLLLNGFVGFQWAEDGTALSLWSIRISSLLLFGVGFAIAVSTFNGWIGMSPTNTLGLFIIYFLFNGLMILVYVIMQIILVINTLDDRWPLGDILFGVFFFALGQVFLYAISVQMCTMANHYVDGLFFGSICTLLAVMMVYKYWDSITKEDLEFSVGGKTNVWEIKDETMPLVSNTDEKALPPPQEQQ